MIVYSRAGKTSIQQVLFKNLSPKETFYLETTMRIVRHRIELVFGILSRSFILLTIPLSTVIPLELWDCPGNTTVTSLGVPLSEFAAIVFVIDIRVRSAAPSRRLAQSHFRICITSRSQSLLNSSLLHTQKIQKSVLKSSSTKLRNCRRTTKMVRQSTTF